MKRAFLSLIAIASLSACSDRPKLWTESEIQDIAGDAAGDAAADTDHEDRIADLESRIDALEERIGVVSDLAVGNYNAHESLRKTFNANVKIDNDARDARRTARGECGYTQVAAGAGFVWQPKPC